MKLWGLYNPSGELIEVTGDEWGAKVAAFDRQSMEFREKYWHKGVASWRALKKAGWKIVPGSFVPDTEGK